MTFVDIVWMVVILSGAGYLLYRSLIKKKGCSTCSCDCPVKSLASKKVLIKH